MKVPKEIIVNQDSEQLRKWFRSIGGSAQHIKNGSGLHSLFSAIGYDNKPIKEDNIYYRLDCDNKVRKCKFKNLNKIFHFYN